MVEDEGEAGRGSQAKVKAVSSKTYKSHYCVPETIAQLLDT
jgi:hypothetical protein